MLDLKVDIRSSSDADASLPKIRSDIMASAIGDAQKTFLIETVDSTLGLWRAQLSLAHMKSLRAEKRFEGEGYRVILRTRPSGGIGAGIMRLLGKR